MVHHGQIDVKTEEGVGSVFTITIALNQAEIRLDTPPQAPQAANAGRGA